MGNILILFETNNRGYTKKMAELVAEGSNTVPGIHFRVLSVETATIDDLRWAHGIALGSPTNLGGIHGG